MSGRVPYNAAKTHHGDKAAAARGNVVHKNNTSVRVLRWTSIQSFPEPDGVLTTGWSNLSDISEQLCTTRLVVSERHIFRASNRRHESVAEKVHIERFTPSGEPDWRFHPGFIPAAIAADSLGNVYCVPSSGAAFVAKIKSGGKSSAPRLDLGSGLKAAFIAIDTTTAVWVGGSTIAGVDTPLKTTAGDYQQTLPNTTAPTASSHA